jgi:hypothetical protein
MKNEQSDVVEATMLGENCGCCKWIKSLNLGALIFCGLGEYGNEIAEWDGELRPKRGTEHPPGRSVCPHFEEQE